MRIASQFGFGLKLRSDMWVPGAIDLAPGLDLPSVRVVLGPASKAGSEAHFAVDGEAIVYCHPTGVFRCLPDRIEVTPDGHPDLSDLGTLLVANALPAVLWQRGAFVLHAACVRLAGGLTIAIAGASGSGKSRLAASLVEAGAELVGDDSLALTADNGRVVAAGLPGGWFVRKPKSEHREFRHDPGGLARGMVQLDALAILGQGAEAPLVGTHLAALELLLQHRHRPQVPQLLGLLPRVLSSAGRIVRDVPIFGMPSCTGSDAMVQLACSDLVSLANKARCDRRLAGA